MGAAVGVVHCLRWEVAHRAGPRIRLGAPRLAAPDAQNGHYFGPLYGDLAQQLSGLGEGGVGNVVFAHPVLAPRVDPLADRV